MTPSCPRPRCRAACAPVQIGVARRAAATGRMPSAWSSRARPGSPRTRRRPPCPPCVLPDHDEPGVDGAVVLVRRDAAPVRASSRRRPCTAGRRSRWPRAGRNRTYGRPPGRPPRSGDGIARMGTRHRRELPARRRRCAGRGASSAALVMSDVGCESVVLPPPHPATIRTIGRTRRRHRRPRA